MTLRVALGIAVALLPRRLRQSALRRLFGFSIDRSASIGFSFILSRELVMGANSRIGHLTVIRGVSKVVLGDSASVGNLNWITGCAPSRSAGAFRDQPERQPQMMLGDHAAITSRHLIDCTDLVAIGRFAILGGFRSQVLTHSVSLGESRQRCKPVMIGDYAFVGTGAILLPGSRLPAHSVLGAGSVLNLQYLEEHWLYAGNPARPVKQLDADAAYFGRTTGYVV